ncbi:hypothetical protein JHK86_018239 [Glycine max]|nr:hypothetical protein JHK86_018239 [Glycine max]
MHHSIPLRVKSERDEANPRGDLNHDLILVMMREIFMCHHSRFSRSNLSMPNLETLGFILQDALFHTNDIGTTVEAYNRLHRKSVSLPLKIDKSLDHFKEAEIVEIVEGSSRDVNPSLLSYMIMEKIKEIDEQVTCD